jgi:hypothetical protein
VRGDATEMAGAWNAAIFKAALDAGLYRYQQWGFSSAEHSSHFDDGSEVMPAAYNVVELYRRMEGSTRLKVTASKRGDASGARVDALAAADAAGTCRVLAYHFRPERASLRVETASVRITGLPRNRRYRLTRYRVDRTRGSYFSAWEALRGKDTAAGDPSDALVLHRLSPGLRKLWDAHREELRALSARGTEPEGKPAWIRTGADGSWMGSISLPANSVALLELEPAR